MRFEGGFQGRCNKLVDGCYSFWQAGLLPLLHRALFKEGTVPPPGKGAGGAGALGTRCYQVLAFSPRRAARCESATLYILPCVHACWFFARASTLLQYRSTGVVK